VVAGGVQLALQFLFGRADPAFAENAHDAVQPRRAVGVAPADVVED
jgi:hypothetical protein